MEKNVLLRKIPKVDDVLRNEVISGLNMPLAVVTDAVRGTLDDLRNGILNDEITAVPDEAALCAAN